MGDNYFIVGGAGFIGGHFVDRLLDGPAARVTVFDNFSSGREWHLERHVEDARLQVVRGDARNVDDLVGAMTDHEVVIHLASNPDIARAATEPAIDFDQGTLLTHHVVEAMRRTGAGRILYASGSGVYGDLGDAEATEDWGPLVPVSTYGASKLAGEAMIAAYCHMFDLTARVFRFGNVVGPHQTHGVGFDFLRNLLKDPTRLVILGDGSQSKSYIHVSDVIDAVMTAHRWEGARYEAFNVATGDYITVSEIADLAARALNLDPKDVAYEYTGGDRGWKGDVPIVRVSTGRIRSLGWACQRSSAEALTGAMRAMLDDADRALA